MVTTKSEEVKSVESVVAIKRMVEAASKYLPLEQLAVSPPCGFSGRIGVPHLPDRVEWQKFEVLVQIWGYGTQSWTAILFFLTTSDHLIRSARNMPINASAPPFMVETFPSRNQSWIS